MRENTTLLLRYSAPFHFGQVLDFMRPRAMAGVERVTDDSYSRTFRNANTRGYFSVRDNPALSALELSILCDDIGCFMQIHNRVRRMFDLDTDFTAINTRFAGDPLLSRGMKNGCVPRLPIAFDPFEFMIRAILGQQITVKAAATLAGRIIGRAAIRTEESFPDGLELCFPTAEELIKLDLDGLGVTRTRQATIRTATQALIDGVFSLSANQDFESFSREFSSLKGIGPWTVNYVGMRGLGMIDSFPASDLGIIKAMVKGDTRPPVKEILKHSEQWSPYRTYAALCLWNTLED